MTSNQGSTICGEIIKIKAENNEIKIIEYYNDSTILRVSSW